VLGGTLSGTAREAQGGILTLLFADIVGYTQLISAAGDVAGEAVRREAFALLRHAAAVHGGREVKKYGDGMMVAFTSAAAAIDSAVEAQRAFAARNSADARPVHVRIGINAGEVIEHEDDYYGVAVNVASRLCDLAEADEVLVSDLVRRLLGARHEGAFADRGEVPLKGVAEAVRVYSVDWRAVTTDATLDPAAFAVPPLPQALLGRQGRPFAGREDALQELEEAWSQAAAGQRRVVFVAGEPGIGKTRLVSEFAARAYAEGAVVLYGGSDEETLLPYQPWVEAITQYVRSLPQQALWDRLAGRAPELARLVPEIQERLPGSATVRHSEVESERFRMFEAVAAWLRSLTERAPVVLVLDDLHWADRPSLLLLAHVARDCEDCRLLILGTMRHTEPRMDFAVPDLLADLRRDMPFAVLEVRGLNPAEVRTLIELRRGYPVDRAELPLSDAVHRETEGNPFFIEEVLRFLAETGVIYKQDGRWITTRTTLDSVPEGIKAMVRSRIGRLSPDTGRALALAAVIGRHFPLEVLEEVWEGDAGDLLRAVEEAVAAALVEEPATAADDYSFSHGLIRESIYADLSATRRTRLHRQIAAVLERLYGQDPRHLAELAYHFLEAAAGDLDKAVYYAALAGDRALTMLAYEEAALHYRRGLDAARMAREADPERTCRLLLGLGEALARTGDPAARATFEEAFDTAGRAGLPDALARAALGAGGRFVWGEVGAVNQKLVAMLEAALAGLGDTPTGLRARVLARLAGEIHFAPDSRRKSVAAEAVATARASGDEEALLYALVAQYYVLLGPEAIDLRLGVTDELLRRAAAIDNRELLLQGHHWRINDLLQLGRGGELDAELETAALIAEELRDPHWLMELSLWRTARALMLGRYGEAERLALETLSLGEATHYRIATMNFGVHLMLIRRDQGRFGELLAATRQYVEDFPGVSSWRAGLTLILAESGEMEEARSQFDVLAEDRFGSIPRDMLWLCTIAILALACERLGDGERAGELYDLLAPYAGLSVVAGFPVAYLGPADYFLGILAQLRGDAAAAADHLLVAERHNRELGATPWLADVLGCQARLARAAGDAARATTLWREARALADSVGMVRQPGLGAEDRGLVEAGE